ncbi:hypothetical protein L7F22_059312 [Adiantum nelumboides]|nr:hypothetical protein [Adiantum nelumboides]
MGTESSDNSPLLTGIDEAEDEQQQQQHVRHNEVTSLTAVFSISTTIVGAGIMGLPETLRINGLVPALLLIIGVALLTDKSVDFLLKHTTAAEADTYGAVMSHSFGCPGRVIAQLCIIVNSFGTLVVYLIIIADVLSGSTAASVHYTGVLEELAGGHTWWNTRFTVMVFTVVCLIPLVLLSEIDSLKVSSALAVLLAIFFVLATAVIACCKLVAGDIGVPRLFPDFYHSNVTIWTCFSVVPVVVTAFLCQHCAHPILAELNKTSDPHVVVRCALVLCTAIYLSTSLFAYLLFGENTLEDVLSNFNADLGVPYISSIVRIGYAIHLYLVFPLLHFSLRKNLAELMFSRADALVDSRRRFYLLTGCAMLVCLVCACLVASIWVVFEITGSSSAIGLCYILPAALELRIPLGTHSERMAAWFMLVVGIISALITWIGLSVA